MMKWSELSRQEKAAQFVSRGTERKARTDVRSDCIICERPIPEGSDYFELNGVRFAHKTCVNAHSTDAPRERKVVTKKMMEAAAERHKSEQISNEVISKPEKKKRAASARVKPVPSKKAAS